MYILKINSYDEFNRLSTYYEGKKETPSENETIRYEYNDRDDISKVIYPNNLGIKSVLYEYDSKYRLTQIRAITDDNSTPKVVRMYTYSPKGNVTTIKDYAGFNHSNNKYILKTYTYDKFDRVTNMNYKNSDDLKTIVEEYNYTYDKNGNILTEDIYNNYIESQPINELKEYTYDTLGRLTNVKVTDRANENNISETSYTYDKVGNRLTKTKGETTENYTYNNLNELLNVKVNDNIIKEYTYDENGNTLKETNGNEEINYQYNINNQMTKYENSNGVKEENEYNIDEQRVSKKVTVDNSSKVNNYYYDRGNLLYTTDDNNTMLTSNILNLEGNVISSARTNSDYLYFFTYNKDSRNSTSSIVDFTNEALVSYKYDEFGETQELTGISTTADYPTTEYNYRLDSIDNEICYTGGIYDKETGEYYLNARYYDPSTARFTTVDTYRGESSRDGYWHLYAYCSNDPLNYIDPTGHWKYNRDKAISYAEQHHNDGKALYPVDNDCTGFVSRCLRAGHFKQDASSTKVNWYFNSGTNHSKSWYYSPDHLKYFKTKKRKYITIKNKKTNLQRRKEIYKKIKGKNIRRGDLMYFDFEPSSKDGTDHTVMIKKRIMNKKKKTANFSYYAHSDSYNRDTKYAYGSLVRAMSNNKNIKVYIIGLKNSY